jgi:hypothetical protein
LQLRRAAPHVLGAAFHLAAGLRPAGSAAMEISPRLSGQQQLSAPTTINASPTRRKPMFSGIPIIGFGMTEGRHTNVFINDRPAGAMQRYEGTIWTYDHGGLSLVGSHSEIRRAIAHHNRPGAVS